MASQMKKHRRILGLTIFLMACSPATPSTSDQEYVSRGLRSVSCWAIEEPGDEARAQILNILIKHADYTASEMTALDDPWIEVINFQNNYFILYYKRMPRYGVLIETFWQPGSPHAQDWEGELFASLSNNFELESCIENRTSFTPRGGVPVEEVNQKVLRAQDDP